MSAAGGTAPFFCQTFYYNARELRSASALG